MLLHSQWCSVAAEESVADHTTVPHSIELNCTDQRLIAKWANRFLLHCLHSQKFRCVQEKDYTALHWTEMDRIPHARKKTKSCCCSYVKQLQILHLKYARCDEYNEESSKLSKIRKSKSLLVCIVSWGDTVSWPEDQPYQHTCCKFMPFITGAMTINVLTGDAGGLAFVLKENCLRYKQPAWTFDRARIRVLVTQFRVQNQVKMKLDDKQVLKVGCNKKPPSLIVR